MRVEGERDHVDGKTQLISRVSTSAVFQFTNSKFNLFKGSASHICGSDRLLKQLNIYHKTSHAFGYVLKTLSKLLTLIGPKISFVLAAPECRS